MAGGRVPIPDLYAALRRLIAQIPAGRVSTYGDLAEALGSVRAARWVGEFLSAHDHSESCCCHRVVRRTGEIGLYVSGDPAEKIARLREDSVIVEDGRVDLQRVGFTGFRSRKPLRRLVRLQEELHGLTRLSSYRRTPEIVAGVDLSYEQKSPAAPGWACATYAAVDTRRLQLADTCTIRRRVRFPYIPGFLSFREAPLLLELLDQVAATGPLADVVLVDGNGILHPRRAGLATFVGVHGQARTIGVGKSLLCGTVGRVDPVTGAQPVRVDGDHVGYAIAAGRGSRSVYVSPGHRLSVSNSLRLVRGLFAGHRVPEPIFHADRLSRLAVKSLRDRVG